MKNENKIELRVSELKRLGINLAKNSKTAD
jgi:hypothetical protein